MQMHELKPKHKSSKRKRIGRGGKKGTYSGKGVKGQKCRAGRKMQPVARELIKKYPKLKGYRIAPKFKGEVIINLSLIEDKFKHGDVVSPRVLINMGIISRIKGKVPKVKILGKGELKKKVSIEECVLSKSAKEKIEKAGGKIL